MIAETRDPAIINRFARLNGMDLDFSGAINEGTAYFFGEHGGFCFERFAPGAWEIHALVTPQGRGRWLLDAFEGIVPALIAKGVGEVWVRTKDRHIALCARWAGFAPAGDRDGWPMFRRTLCHQQSLAA